MRLLIAFFALSGVFLTAQEAPTDPVELLGLGPQEVYRALGTPVEIFTAPIDATHNHVGHLYPSFLTVYWFANHVWQVRIDRRSTLTFSGLQIGQPRSEVEAFLGPPKVQSATGVQPSWAAWPLPFRSFPRVLKLGFENGLIVDALFSRGDLP